MPFPKFQPSHKILKITHDKQTDGKVDRAVTANAAHPLPPILGQPFEETEKNCVLKYKH
jgi:hypothetical protein